MANQLRDFFRPHSPQEAVSLLSQMGQRAVLLGGGTFLHGLAARNLLAQVEGLIDLQAAGLTYMRAASGGLEIGATTTFSALLRWPGLREKLEFAALVEALEQPPPQIRNQATLAGSIAAATPLFDPPIALLALDAQITALGDSSERRLPLEQFFRHHFEHSLERHELISEVYLPPPPPRSASAFLKLQTNANDLALVNAAVRVSLDAGGVCAQARLFLGGGVGEVPVRGGAGERLLTGQRATSALLEKAAEAVAAGLQPLSDHRASARYRSAMAKVYLRKALERAFARLGIEVN